MSVDLKKGSQARIEAQLNYPYSCFRYQTATATFKMSEKVYKITRLQLEVRTERLKWETM